MSIETIFNDMSYDSKTESEDDIMAWLDKHQRTLQPFISGKEKDDPNDSVVEVLNLSTDKVLASIKHNANDLSKAVESAKAAQRQWINLSAVHRTKLLLSLSNNILKKCNFLAKLESLSTGRLFRYVNGTTSSQVPNTLQYYSKWTGALSKENFDSPLGVVLVSLSSNSSILLAVQKISPALARGNSVVLYLDGSQDLKTVNLGLFYLVELFIETGIPVGVLTVVYGAKEIWQMPHICRIVGGISYIGTLEGGQKLRQCTPGSGGFLTFFLEYRYVVLVFESADIDSAVDASVQIMKHSFDQKCKTRILVQESVYARFIQLLQSFLANMKVGHSLASSADVGPIIKDLVEDVTKKVSQLHLDSISQICLPQLDILTFRTTKEATSLASDSVHDVRASIWTENITLAMEVMKNISASTVWINCANEYDPSVEVNNRKLSGGGRDGGVLCLYQYIQPHWHSTSRFDSEYVPKPTSDTSYVESVKKAVALAQKSQTGWCNLGFSGRGKILINIVNELVGKHDMKGGSTQGSVGAVTSSELDQIIKQLHFWATDCDRHNGIVQEIYSKGHVLTICEPKGVIGIISSDDCPLLNITPLIICAIAMGNAVVIFAKTLSSPLTHLVQYFTSGGLPNGLIHVVPDISNSTLSSFFDHNVQAVWHIGSQSVASTLEFSSGAKLLQNTWVSFDQNMKWNELKFDDNELLYYLSTSSKVAWLPAGVTFAN